MHLSRPLCADCPHCYYYDQDYPSGFYVCDKSENTLLLPKDLEKSKGDWDFDPEYFPLKAFASCGSTKTLIKKLKEHCPYWLEHVMLNEEFTPLEGRKRMQMLVDIISKYQIEFHNPYKNLFEALGKKQDLNAPIQFFPKKDKHDNTKKRLQSNKAKR